MNQRMDWRKAHLSLKRSLSTKDEAEFRGRDRAAKWLERVESAKPSKSKKRRRAA